MIRIAIQFVGLTIGLLQPGAVVQSTGSIDGVVVAAGSSTPVPRAKVTLMTTSGRQVATIIATIDGRFSLSDIASGDFRIVAAQDGYVANTRGAQLTVVSGRKTDVSIYIVPDGAISGRVVDWDGIPVVGIQVQALTFVQDGQGQRRLNVLKSLQTNDLGEYRIYWLPPGPYFVRADPANSDNSTSVRYALSSQIIPNSAPASQQTVPTYFPGAADSSGARRIDLRAGETSTGVDIRLVNARAHQISGALSAQGSRATSVRLIPRNSVEGFGDVRTTSPDRSGAFRFDGVVPGAYLLTASTLDSDGRTMFGRLQIDVSDRDIENIVVSPIEGFDLQVRTSIQGRSRRSGDPPLVINLRPEISSTPSPTVETMGGDSLTIFRNLMLGDYSVAVLALTNVGGPNGSSLNRNLYLKSAQLGGTDVLTSGLHIDGPISSVLELVMSDDAGTVSGSVLDEKRHPVSGVTVVLVPEPRLRGRGDLYRTTNTDSSGKFEITGIPPGQYKAFSWEAIGQGSWRYPDFMELYEDRGQSIRIDSSRMDPITVQVIPQQF